MERVTKGGMFIGELLKKFHDTKHQLYVEKQFSDLGFDVERGWSEPYCDNKFNVSKVRNDI